MFRRSDLGGVVLRLLSGIALLLVDEHSLVLTYEVSRFHSPAARSVLLGNEASRGESFSLDYEGLLLRRCWSLAASRHALNCLLRGTDYAT